MAIEFEHSLGWRRPSGGYLSRMPGQILLRRRGRCWVGFLLTGLTLAGDTGKPARDGPACGLCTKIIGLPTDPQIDRAFPGTFERRRKRGERLRRGRLVLLEPMQDLIGAGQFDLGGELHHVAGASGCRVVDAIEI